MQYTKEKYYNLLLLSICGSLKIELNQSWTHITRRRRINAHGTQKILRGKPQLKTHYLYYHTRWKYIRIIQSLSSQYNPPRSSQANLASHKPSPLHSKLLFHCTVPLGWSPSPSGTLLSHTALTHCQNFTILKEPSLDCMHEFPL